MDLVRFGDVPAWIGALAAAGATWEAISRHQREQAVDFIEVVQRMADIDGDRLASAVDEDPRIAEVFNRLWATATVSARAEKRRLLARIATAALTGEVDDALLDELLVLADTADAVQPYHVDLLAMMAGPRLGTGQLAGHMITGMWSSDELASAYGTTSGPLLPPLLRALESFGLVENAGTGTYDNQSAWIITAYGDRLLAFLPEQ